MQIRSFELGIYPRIIYVACGEHPEELANYFYERDFSPLFNNFKSTAIGFEKQVISKKGNRLSNVIWFPNFYPTLNVICHEATHAAMDIFRDLGLFIDTDNQEPFTYLVGYIVKHITTILSIYDKKSATTGSCKST